MARVQDTIVARSSAALHETTDWAAAGPRRLKRASQRQEP
jgi:hypothetical protein